LPDEPSGPRTRHLLLAWAPSPHARRLLTLALAALALAIVTRRPEFAGLAAPPLLLLGTWSTDRPDELRLRLHSPPHRIVEGDDVPFGVDLQGQGSHDAELTLLPAAEMAAGPSVLLAGLPGDEPRSSRIRLRPGRWGHRRAGTLAITLRDYARLAEGRAIVELPLLDCAPEPAQLAGSIVLSRLPSRLGEHPARVAGEGAEFDGVREFVPGDRQRRINWPATTRLGKLHLTTFAAERTQNVVIIADTTADIGEPGNTTLDLVVRGAAGVLARYAAGRDRVGLITFGSRMAWIGPGQGRRHLGRLMELLIGSTAGDERRDAISRLPRAALPPGALILVFSPLLDPRLVEAVRDLRERGFTVLVIDVLASGPEHDPSLLSNLTARLWQLEQRAMRFSLTQLGVPVVRWDGTTSLDEPLAPYLRRQLVVRH
jgi:uncharacterized protein (DUF58 family)